MGNQNFYTSRVDITKFPMHIRSDIKRAARYWEQRKQPYFFYHGVEVLKETINRGVLKFPAPSETMPIDHPDRLGALLCLYHGVTDPNKLPGGLRTLIGDLHQTFCNVRRIEEDPNKDWVKIGRYYEKTECWLPIIIRVIDNAVSARAEQREWLEVAGRESYDGHLLSADEITDMQRALAESHLVIGYPLADGLGFHDLARELKNFAVRILHPVEYAKIEKILRDPEGLKPRIEETARVVENILNFILEKVNKLFAKRNNELAAGADVDRLRRVAERLPKPVRVKSAGSIYLKLTKKYGFKENEVAGMIDHIPDLVGGMLQFMDLSYLYQASEIGQEFLSKLYSKEVRIEVDDHFADEKERKRGYGALNIVVKPTSSYIGRLAQTQGIAPTSFELQFHTWSSWRAYNEGSTAHALFKSTRPEEVGPAILRIQDFANGLIERK